MDSAWLVGMGRLRTALLLQPRHDQLRALSDDTTPLAGKTFLQQEVKVMDDGWIDRSIAEATRRNPSTDATDSASLDHHTQPAHVQL